MWLACLWLAINDGNGNMTFGQSTIAVCICRTLLTHMSIYNVYHNAGFGSFCLLTGVAISIIATKTLTKGCHCLVSLTIHTPGTSLLGAH